MKVKSRRINILATNGDWAKVFMYFIQRPSGDFYFGEVSKHEPEHTSYHVSGIAHSKRGDKLSKLGKGQPLTDFKGLQHLIALSVGRGVFTSSIVGSNSATKKSDGSVIIDLRRYPLRVGIQAYILEPLKFDLLEGLGKRFNDVQIAIFTETTPWLVLAIHQTGRPLKQDDNTAIAWDRATIKVQMQASEEKAKMIEIDAPATLWFDRPMQES